VNGPAVAYLPSGERQRLTSGHCRGGAGLLGAARPRCRSLQCLVTGVGGLPPQIIAGRARGNMTDVITALVMFAIGDALFVCGHRQSLVDKRKGHSNGY
jgi:hypothetical protein